MTHAEAGALFDLLCAAYPTVSPRESTADLWLDELRPLDAALGEKAIRSLIAGSRFWPSVAELNEQVTVAREQAARVTRERERREAEQELHALERPPLREIPSVVAFLERWREPLPLERTSDGDCGECGARGDRFTLGRFALCHRCAKRRLDARTRVDAGNGGEAA
jgi:hypothetical protein